MKVKIKGLVFVGFAAAILSANAMADDTNTVTSKAYTEATYQHRSTKASIGGANGTWTDLATEIPDTPTNADANTAPSTKAVADALNEVTEGLDQLTLDAQVKSTTDYQLGGTGGTWKTVEAGTYVAAPVAGVAENSAKIDIDTSMIVGTKADVTSGTNQLTTAAGVKAYAQKISESPNQISDGNGGWKALDSAPTQDSPNGVTSGGVYTAVDAKLNHNLGANNADKILVINSQGEVVPSNATGANTYQSKSTDGTLAIADGAGGWTTLKTKVNDGTYVEAAEDATTKALTVDIKAAQIAGDQAAVTSGTTELTTAAGVKGYAVKIAQGSQAANKTLVTDAAGNVTVSSIASSPLPAKPAACTDATPCALVADATGGIQWVPMAQPE